MLYKRMLQIHGIKLSKIYVPLFKTIFFNQPMYYNKLICHTFKMYRKNFIKIS